MTNREEAMVLTSIIIPVFNKERYLQACVDSALAQKDAKVEILCINDGSTDRSLAVLEEYSDRENVRIISTENHGISAARNRGLAEAKGTYVLFLDADDRLPETAVRTLVSCAEKENADIVSGRQETYENGVLIDRIDEPKAGIARGKDMLRLCMEDFGPTHHVWAAIFRREFIQDIRFEETAIVHEDSHFMFECALKEPVFLLIEDYVYCYTLDHSSLSHSGFTRKKAESILMLAEKEYQAVRKQAPELAPLAENLLIKADMAVLANCPDSDIASSLIPDVRKRKQYFIPESTFDRMLFTLITWHLYGVYRLLYAVRFGRKH